MWSLKFVEVDVLEKAGYESRKAMKAAMYSRAKVSNSPPVPFRLLMLR
jgi:hypothetical protein